MRILRPAASPAVWLALQILAAALPAAAAAPDLAHYVLDPAKSSLEFTFFSPENLAASRLDVIVEMSSVDTGDQERDDAVRAGDLLAVAKFLQAHFAASQINKTAAGYEAVGKLTIRGVTHDMRVPFSFRTATEGGAAVGYMSGKTSLLRLDYGVGQGDYKATDQVGNEVGVAFALRLTAH
jgi:polyisoprenoid-binding protein YceI